jgi:hypothetical protein
VPLAASANPGTRRDLLRRQGRHVDKEQAESFRYRQMCDDGVAKVLTWLRAARQLQSLGPNKASVDIVDPLTLTSVPLRLCARSCACFNRF